jgi:hypothetical protein
MSPMNGSSNGEASSGGASSGGASNGGASGSGKQRGMRQGHGKQFKDSRKPKLSKKAKIEKFINLGSPNVAQRKGKVVQ